MGRPLMSPETGMKPHDGSGLRWFALLLVLLGILLLPVCVQQKMTLEEASRVTVSVTDHTYRPPPRRVDDILAVLRQIGPFDSAAASSTRAAADKAPPETEDPARLARFFYRRGLKALSLSRYRQWLEDHRRALNHQRTAKTQGAAGLGARDTARLLVELARVESVFGNVGQGIAYLKQSLRIRAYNPMRKHSMLASLYFKAGNLKAGRRTIENGIRICDEILQGPKVPLRKRAQAKVQKALLQAALLEVQGRHREAEPFLRTTIRVLDEQLGDRDRRAVLGKRRKLADNLARQGRLMDAEIEIRDALKTAVGFAGSESGEIPGMLSSFGNVLMMQGRLEEAEEVLRAGIQELESGGFPMDSLVSGRIWKHLGAVSVARGDFAGAMERFDRIREAMGDNVFMLNQVLERNPDYMLALLKNGHVQEAMEIISHRYLEALEHFGTKRYRTIELLALRGMAHAMKGEDRSALEDFAASIPRLLDKGSNRSNLLKEKRLEALAEAYLDLLARVHESGRERALQIDVSADAFEVCQALNSSVVQSALGESGARAAARDPDLAELVRKEQDASKQIESLKEALSGAMAVPPDQQDPGALADLRGIVGSLTKARDTILEEIQSRFPRYADFVDPQPPGFPDIQGMLKQTEALIVVYPAGGNTFVWSVSGKGPMAFAVAPLGVESIRERVLGLRQTLAPSPGSFGDVPAYDLARAQALYSAILEPVKPGWEDAEDLLIVASGPFGQIPFSVLPVGPVSGIPESDLLFAGYRDVPWLIRRCSITRLPSAASLVTLRSLPEGDPGRKPFIGFGDPCFDLDRRAEAETIVTRGGKGLKVRGIRKTHRANLDSEAVTSSRLHMLGRLPDTAEEIVGIAEALQADPAHDVFLGEQASEARVKGMDLSDRKVIAFATHGLIPGDLDGLDQPALAMSAPSAIGDEEDGLLTMDEILGLRTNSDWVVLSACNTGAGDGAGTEAVSGLGRAFFYAGTRALLVTLWPVETTSAGRLTTGLFRSQQEDGTLSRARALRKAMLDLMDRQVFEDDSSGRTVASYAHPFFWAPFVVIGEGG